MIGGCWIDASKVSGGGEGGNGDSGIGEEGEGKVTTEGEGLGMTVGR